MRRPLALLVLAALLPLAGCIGTPAATDVPTSAGGDDGAAPPPKAASGYANFTVGLACTPGVGIGVCLYLEQEAGPLNVSEPASAFQLVATWTAATPLQDTLRVEIYEGENRVAAQNGESPLTLELDRLAAGDYQVLVWPVGGSAPVEQSVAWEAQWE